MLALDPFKLTPIPEREQGKTVKVIVAGLPRTGTASLKLALEKLGFGPCHHFADPPNQYNRLRLTADLVNTPDRQLRRQKLARLLDGCEAILDQPVCSCLPDLLEMYPDAKVILTERSSAKVWLESWNGSAGHLRDSWWRYVGYLVPAIVSTSDIMRAWTRISAARFGVPDDVTEELYHAHNAWVRRHVPARRLLVYRVEMGYRPLCKFLGREELSGAAFPRSERSDRATFRLYKWLCMACGVASWLGSAVLVWLGWILVSGSVGTTYLAHLVTTVTDLSHET